MAVRYYLSKDPVYDTTTLSIFTSVVDEWLGQAQNGNAIIRTVKFLAAKGITGQIAEESFDIIINGENNTASIGGSIVDLAVTNAAQKVLEAIVIAGTVAAGIQASMAVGTTII